MNRPPTVSILSPPRSIAAYAMAQLTIDVHRGGGPYDNPFDPEQVAIDLIATGPRGARIVTPAFWWQPFRRTAQGQVELRAHAAFVGRIAFSAPGAWKVVAEVRDREGVGRSQPVTVQVSSSHSDGFLITHPKTCRYFVRSATGAGQLLIGENVGWAGKGGLNEYDAWFERLAAAGGNFARVWMAWQQLETKATGIGRYDLTNAAYFDQILTIAARRGLRVMLAFGTYGELRTGGYFNEGRWPDNPYNQANGGPIPSTHPERIFTDQTARALYRRRLRYLVARYAAFTSLGLWELWNETDAPASWLTEMASAIRRIDPYRHPIANSYTTTGRDDQNRAPGIDLTQTHRYGDAGSVPDITPVIVSDQAEHERYRKPHLMAEFGISWRGPDAEFDPNGTGTNLHNGLWAGALSGGAGGAAIWWWDNYVHPKNLYGAFTGLARFAATVAWADLDLQPIDVAPPLSDSRSPETFDDLTLRLTEPYGVRSSGVTRVLPGGGTAGAPPISFLMGPAKRDLATPLTLELDLPRPTSLTLRIGKVSDRARIRATVDGRVVAEFPFRAAPGPGQEFESTKQFPEYGGIWQAVFNKDRTVTLPAGKHTLRLENVEGDWVTVDAITIPGGRSSRMVSLRPLALQCRRTGTTLLWLQDPDSNWANDRAGKTPRLWERTTVKFALPRPGRWAVTWWDTRRGVTLGAPTVVSPSGRDRSVTLPIPAFRRDIALQIRPAARELPRLP